LTINQIIFVQNLRLLSWLVGDLPKSWQHLDKRQWKKLTAILWTDHTFRIIMKLMKIEPKVTNTKQRQCDKLVLYQFVAFQLTWVSTYQKVDSTWIRGLKKVDSNFVKIVNSIQILWSDATDLAIIYSHKGDEGLHQKSTFQHKRLSRYIWVDSKKGHLGLNW